MKRIDTFGATFDNKFTSGDPIGGVPATRVSADFMNVIQEEIAGVVESAGITLDQGTPFASGHDTTQLYDAIQAIVETAVNAANILPVGSIVPFAGPPVNIPAGWLECDGSILNRADFIELFDAIGTAWGTTSSLDFRIPDLRGHFLRGLDGGTGIDPQAALRTAKYAGGNTGDAVGTYQSDDVGPHTHSYTIPLGDNSNDNASPPAASNGSVVGINYVGTTASSSGLESRPKNASVIYIIRAGA